MRMDSLMSPGPKCDVCILIIDDNPASVDLMANALAGDGVDIITSTDPEEGLDLIFQRHPQIVLTDLVMPKLSGIQLLERIVEFDPSIDVILMTAHYSTESAVEAIKKGATDYLNEPVSIATIRERTRKIDIRVIAATNKDLRAAIADKAFREDLYYRLTMVELHVPSLNERPEDLALLIHHFIERFSHQFGKSIFGITNRAQIVLSRYTWPGNIRELENVIGHACMIVMGDTIDVGDLPIYLRAGTHSDPASSHAVAVPATTTGDSLEENERMLVAGALERAQGNQSEAARLLSIGRDALRYKMKKFNLA